jgi:Transglutaminase-like superfamily
MIRYLMLLLCLSGLNCAFAQDYTLVDTHARSVDIPPDLDVADLAKNLTQGLRADTEKVRAIFIWLNAHITYDIKAYESSSDPDWQTPKQVLKRKKGLCEGYSNLFTALCEAGNVKVFKVEGISKDREGNTRNGGHAWNLVKVEAGWRCIDATWGAGYISVETNKYVSQLDEKYFLAEPNDFIQRHLPDDPLMQMLPNPINRATFEMGGIRFDRAILKAMELPARAGFEAIQDSLDCFHALEPEIQRFNKARRVFRFDKYNDLANFDLGIYHFKQAVDFMAQYYKRLQSPEFRVQVRNEAYLLENMALLKSSEQAAEKGMNYFDVVRNHRRPTADSNSKKLTDLKKDIQLARQDNEAWLKKAKS